MEREYCIGGLVGNDQCVEHDGDAVVGSGDIRVSQHLRTDHLLWLGVVTNGTYIKVVCVVEKLDVGSFSGIFAWLRFPLNQAAYRWSFPPCLFIEYAVDGNRRCDYRHGGGSDDPFGMDFL